VEYFCSSIASLPAEILSLLIDKSVYLTAEVT